MGMLQRNLVTASGVATVGGITLGPFNCNGSIFTFTLENTGAVALATFVLQAKCHPNDLAFQTIFGAANWASTNPLVVQSGVLATLAGPGTGFAQIRVAGFYQIQFTVTSASATTPVNVNGMFTEAQ